MSDPAISITVLDHKTGETQTLDLPAGDYALICADPCYRAHVTAHANGTHVITVKGRTQK